VDLRDVSQLFERAEEEVRRVFVGQDDVLSSVLVAIFARGHVLLEGVPGVGKTLLVRALGTVLGCHFRRVQFTPDLMPSDVTGSTMYNSQKGAFEFKHGPVFTNIMLADEVNRAPAKTQSSMLEAMAERSTTVDGITHPLPDPFFVLATQNPLESAGTYALPEAQLDRFLFKVLIDHPSVDVEKQLLRNVRDGFDASDLDAANLQRVTNAQLVLEMQAAIRTVAVDEKIITYIAELVANTRRHRAVQIGASPRAGIALLNVARVEAAVQGRPFVVPDDVKTHGRAVLRHRLILQPDAEIEGVTTDEVIEAVLHETQVPGMGDERRGQRGVETSAVRDRFGPAERPRDSFTRDGHVDRVGTQRPPEPRHVGPSSVLSQPRPPSSAKPWDVPDDVTLMPSDKPAPSAPARSAGAPSGSAPSRPAGVDPDTIPPAFGPFGDGNKR
jgi:MoxR-like ATPase